MLCFCTVEEHIHQRRIETKILRTTFNQKIVFIHLAQIASARTCFAKI